MKVQAYRNLKFKEVRFSIRAGGRVIETRPSVTLSDCTFKHATADQIHRCRFGGANGTGCREVCQWVSGTIVENKFEIPELNLLLWDRLVADPRQFDGFQNFKTKKKTISAAFVHLSSTGCAYYLP